MPKLVVENTVTKYLIVCDGDIPELLGEDIDTVAISLSSLKKAAKSIQHCPVGGMRSYQQLMEDLSIAQDSIQVLENNLRNEKQVHGVLINRFWFLWNRFGDMTFWERLRYLYHGYEKFVIDVGIDVGNEFSEGEKIK